MSGTQAKHHPFWAPTTLRFLVEPSDFSACSLCISSIFQLNRKWEGAEFVSWAQHVPGPTSRASAIWGLRAKFWIVPRTAGIYRVNSPLIDLSTTYRCSRGC
jgi:hypothetical protein